MLLPHCHAKWKFQMMTLSLLHRKELSKFCSSQREVVPGLGTSWILEWCYCAFKLQHRRSSCSSCSFSHLGRGADRKLAKLGSIGLAAHTHTHCVTELCVLGGLDIREPLWNYLPVLGIPVEQLLFCLGFSLPGNPRHIVSTAEGWGASGRREMYPSQSQNLVSLSLFLWYIFWKCLGKDTGDMDGDEKLLRYWKM